MHPGVVVEVEVVLVEVEVVGVVVDVVDVEVDVDVDVVPVVFGHWQGESWGWFFRWALAALLGRHSVCASWGLPAGLWQMYCLPFPHGQSEPC
jgi:hypothetical protein